LTKHKNPYRFFSTIVNLIFNEVIKQFPEDSFIYKGEPTLKEIADKKDKAEVRTKRYLFYIRLLADMMSSLSYEPRCDENKSVMVYMNKKLPPIAIKDIESFLAGYGLLLM
jgi:hypothetical protein